MVIFHSDNVGDTFLTLSAEDSAHCAKVLRHKAGDVISVIDGAGTMYECTVTDASVKAVRASINAVHRNWNSHPYHLTMAVCPTKNNERFEWFVEKAVEIGVDRIVPLIGERSERKVYKTERAGKIALSAAKQSLKAVVPEVSEPVSVKDFLNGPVSGQRFIACCFDDPSVPRISLKTALSVEAAGKAGMMRGHGNERAASGDRPELTVLIGPEGDFSPAEAELALKTGCVPVHLGDSRLRTETAAVIAAAMVYTAFME